MKKQLFNALLIGLLAMPAISTRADVVDEGQSTEGKDFWVTFMQADQGNSNNGFKLSVSISSRNNCKVYLSNPYSGFLDSIDVTADKQELIELYSGSSDISNARGTMETSKKVCYAGYSEIVDTCALHITATENISLFATNYKIATFDATNVLPTASLKDEYYIQTYSPSDHDKSENATQGSHFAIIAAKDGIIVDFCPTVETYAISKAKEKYGFTKGDGMTEEEIALANWKVGDTLHTPELKAGQVYYVWTGKGAQTDWKAGDLSGTYVKARCVNPKDTAKIAVFQGCPHTNIPYHQKERDHIFSQAMPIHYWGNTFVLTQSVGRKRDVFRIMALNDETEVRINGNLVHTFDFVNGDEDDKKHFFEFEIGDVTIPGDRGGKGDVLRVDGPVCFVETSCPCSVHEFMTSRGYDQGTSSGDNGDPAMLWVNPIEQQIDQITFATYASDNSGKSDYASHYVNIITENPAGMMLGNDDISSEFTAVPGSNYYYARHTLDKTSTNPDSPDHDGHSYTLKNTEGSFIAHVYGFTANESYGYSAGGATKPMTQYIIINGEVFTPDSKNTLCGEDTVKFECHPDYEYEKVVWNFGDGVTDTVTYAEAQVDSIIPHYYADSKTYEAYVLIYRESSNLCKGQNAIDSIPIAVTIGRYQFTVKPAEIPCPEDGKEYIGKIPYSNPGNVDLHGDNVTLEFDSIAKADGFDDKKLIIHDDYFQISIPDAASADKTYGIHLVITSDCGGADTTLTFGINFDNDILTQRYGYLLGLNNSMSKYQLSDFQWYRLADSTAVEGQVTANLNFYELENGYAKPGDAFFVCFTRDKGTANETKQCSCAKAFETDTHKPDFGTPDDVIITASYAWLGDKIFVNADWKGKTDIECFAQWITVSGDVHQDMKFNIPDGGCTIPVPQENGFYILRVTTDGSKRSFKFIINH